MKSFTGRATGLARRAAWLALQALTSAWICACALAAPSSPGDAERGRLLYDTGADAAGHRLQAIRSGAGPVSRDAVACVSCHRPSTVGGIEGGLLVPPIGGDVLFAPGRPPSTRLNMKWMRHQTRSAYDSAHFAKALLKGIDPDGQTLGPEMPRYAMEAQDVRDLEAYLRARGLEKTPGLVGGSLHVATVFTPDAPKARRETVMKVMQAWAVGLKFGPVPVVWHPWELQGEPASWPAQLEALVRRTPVFGLVSGAGGAHWEPVQDFCERQRIACVFPSVDRIPGWTAPPRHTAYLSAGVEGEARMLANSLAVATRPTSEVRQIWRGDAALSATKILDQALAPALRPARASPWEGPRTRPPVRRNGVLVLWLDAEEASAWLQANRPGPERAVFLSAQLAPIQLVRVPQIWRPHLRWVSMRTAPADFYGGLAVALEPWAQALAARGGVSPVEFGDARAAGFLFGDAAGLTQGVLRPDYLMERLETSVKQRVAASVYVQASLGPMQRVASKGGFVLGFRYGGNSAPVEISPYLRAVP